LYRASAQICMVSASGTLVKRLEMSKEQRKTDEGEKVKCLGERKVSETQMLTKIGGNQNQSYRSVVKTFLPKEQT